MADNAVKAAFDELIALSKEVKAAGELMMAALEKAAANGTEIRDSDVATCRTRFIEQIPLSIEKRAGALLPPIKGTLNIKG